MSGISRKLPDTERARLKSILKQITPDDAGVIVRTAAEGATEEALERDVNRLKAQWEVIEKKAQDRPRPPSLIYGEPDLVIRVVRDIFNEDFSELVVQGDDEWDTIDNYVRWVAPDLARTGPALDRGRGRLHGVPRRRAAGQGARPQGLAAQRRLRWSSTGPRR